MPSFEPPTTTGPADVTDEEYVRQGITRTARRLFPRYGGVPRGVSVLKIDGTYRTVDGPDTNVIAQATEVYLGGHIHPVTDTVAGELVAAGYFVDGYSPPYVTGQLAWTEQNDSIAAVGSTSAPLPGTIAWTEQPDTIAAVGHMTPAALVGNIAWTEAPDTIAATGASGSGQFSVVGKNIFNPTGHRIRPVGANVSVYQTAGPYVSNMPAAVGGVRVTATGRVTDVQSWGWNALRVTVIADGDPSVINPVTACSDLIDEYSAAGIIVMPECHDHTGGDIPYNSSSWNAVHTFWANLLAAKGTNPYLWVNYSNEPITMGSDTDPGNAAWLALWNDRYSRVRAISTKAVFVVDAPTYGQGIGDVLARAASFMSGKTNVVFSWHNYGAYGDATAMTSIMNSLDAAGVPVMIGECGYNPDGFSSATTTWANDKRGVDFAIGTWYTSGKGFMWWHATGDDNTTSGYSLRNNPPNNGTFIDTTLPLSTAGAAIWALRNDSHVLS